jgi:hypothetical protein
MRSPQGLTWSPRGPVGECKLQQPRDLKSTCTMATQLDDEMDIYEQDEAHVNANVMAQAEAAQVAEHMQLGLPPLTPLSAGDNEHCFKAMIPTFKGLWKKNHTTSVRNKWASEHQDMVRQHTFHCLYN